MTFSYKRFRELYLLETLRTKKCLGEKSRPFPRKPELDSALYLSLKNYISSLHFVSRPERTLFQAVPVIIQLLCQYHFWVIDSDLFSTMIEKMICNPLAGENT